MADARDRYLPVRKDDILLALAKQRASADPAGSEKFRRLCSGTVPEAEQDRFITLAERLTELGPGQVRLLSLIAPGLGSETPKGGIF